MDNEFLQSSGFPAMQFEPTFWHPTDQDLCQNQTRDNFLLENSMEQSVYDSTLTSLVSSPAASNSNISGAGAGDGLVIRELIGKLGNIGNCSGEMFNGNGIGSHDGTPMSSPPHLTPQNLNLPAATDFSGDPGFAERAARFSCFGSRSFNGRTLPFAVNGNGGFNGSDCVVGSNGNNGDLTRVTSSPSLDATKPQMWNGNKISGKEEFSFPGQHILSGKLSRKRKSSSRGKPIENSTKGSEICEASDSKRSKPSETDCSVKTEQVEERNGKKKQSKTNSKKPTEPLQDFIQVRARRGEATDSHSLAERARREKISERMKLLQDLVPGCNKVTGKALMLDEIINYVQSLQRQVEFLSMKLASVNTRLDFNVDVLKSKDIPFECSAGTLEPSGLGRSFNARLPPLSQFTDMGPMFCQDDLQTIAQMGFGPFGQYMNPDTHTVQDFHGSDQESRMKIEL